MKNITFVCQYLAKGGAERVMSILINQFVKYGYKVKLIMLYENIIDYEIDDTVQIIALEWSRKAGIKKRILRWRQLRKLIDGDIVISFLYSAIRDTVIATLGSQTKLIFSERNDPNNDPEGKLRQIIRDISYFFADKIVFQTSMQMNYFRKNIRKKGIVIEHPVLQNLPMATEGKKIKIVSVCRLTAQKNIIMSLQAFKNITIKYPEAKYCIYGDGELRREIEEDINRLGLKDSVILHGFCRNIHTEIKDATLYISSSNFEGISNSMLEAMGMGLPVVCTNCPIGGAGEVIKNKENGILVPTNDVKALTEAMLELLDNPDLRNKIRKNACEVRNTYSTTKIIEKWVEVVSEVE